ncbi:hypothetical protein NPA07_01320 [Mycoplasmopsis caviae]|uniref:Uncharacterized protein n=1 Tax=Mycoplasmopsis caviae TaxID=55603 RepID=A0A3P8MEH1_9BACT|nr:hypothetical protein [Mycoplasmopsis caviae]UUD35498.1 hypothetical protein NPA07_01320 [Mycoplasmopsis caviae]VDR41726.1 Uncharacterised protein [Mycoplasmopsis caviae]
MILDHEYEKELVVICKNYHEDVKSYKNAKRLIFGLVSCCFLISLIILVFWLSLSLTKGFNFFNVPALIGMSLCFVIFLVFGTMQLASWILIIKAIKYYETGEKIKSLKYYKAYCTMSFKRKSDLRNKYFGNKNNKSNDAK